jgi:hypothetical protein
MMTMKDFNKNAKRPQIFARFSAALLALLCFVATFTACADMRGGNETTPVITDTPTRETEATHEHIQKEHTFIDPTECTEMTHQIKTTCLDCGSVSYSYPTQATWEHNYDPALGISTLGVYVPDAYDPNPDPKGVNWMITRRNVKYDSNGYITSFDIHWHDKDKNCKVITIVVAEVKQMVIDWGYEFPDGERRGVEIAIYDGYYVPRRITVTS